MDVIAFIVIIKEYLVIQCIFPPHLLVVNEHTLIVCKSGVYTIDILTESDYTLVAFVIHWPTFQMSAAAE